MSWPLRVKFSYDCCTFWKNILDGIAFSAIRGYFIVNIEDTKIKPSNKTQKRARNSGMQTITNFNKYAWYIISFISMTTLSLRFSYSVQRSDTTFSFEVFNSFWNSLGHSYGGGTDESLSLTHLWRKTCLVFNLCFNQISNKYNMLTL